MKILKKLLVIAMLAGMLVTLTACGEKENNSNDTDSTMSYLSTRGNNNNSGELKGSKKFLNDLSKLTSDEVVKNAEQQMAEPNIGETIAIFHIENYGDITVKLFDNIAPKAVENFVTHAKEGYYNGLTFHRVINNFMIQGGDPVGDGTGGETIWGEDIEEELDASVLPYRGSLCMASGGTGTKSIGSQFFITQAEYSEGLEKSLEEYKLSNVKKAYSYYGGAISDLVGYAQYTTFGQVIDGMDVVDAISLVETNSKDKPLEDVKISSIEITTYSK